MNSVNLLGRLTRDIDLRYTEGEKSVAVAKFSIAVQREFKRDEADFINCVAFGKTAENMEKFLGKGSQIAINGRIQTGNYTNKEGQKVYTTDIIVNSFYFVGNKQEQQNGGFESVPDGIVEELPFN